MDRDLWICYSSGSLSEILSSSQKDIEHFKGIVAIALHTHSTTPIIYLQTIAFRTSQANTVIDYRISNQHCTARGSLKVFDSCTIKSTLDINLQDRVPRSSLRSSSPRLILEHDQCGEPDHSSSGASAARRKDGSDHAQQPGRRTR